MNKKALLSRNSIIPSQLSVGLRQSKNNRDKSLNSTSNFIVENQIFLLGICGEDFPINTAVGRNKTNNKIYKASNLLVNDLEVLGIANSPGIEGNEIKIKYEGAHFSENANFIPLKPIYLSDGELNYSTNEPDLTSGHLFQKLGYAIDEKSWVIDIESPIEII